ncbi:DMT family transporter [Streptomyces niger]|uniref:DMT family transporter n=1 Tax=Streptomyces niger TaxID=66373 RepID=UPI000B111063|nr:DMT family transporter [Streptomyces niger]
MTVLDQQNAVRTGGAPRSDRPAATRTATARPAVLTGLALALTATVAWSGSFVVTRALHDSVPPVQAVFWRWVIALVAVAPLTLRQVWRQRALLRRHLRFLLLASLLGVALYNTLVHQAGLTTPAGTMGMFMAASPTLMVLFGRFGRGGERIGARRAAGMLIATAGVLTLIGKGDPTALFRLDLNAGSLWMLAAMACFAGYSALLRHKPAEIAGPVFLCVTFLLGAAMLAPAYAVSLTVQGGFTPGADTVGPLLYVGIFSSAVAFFTWNKAIALVGAARAGAVYYLQPVCVALLAHVLLGEHTGPVQVLCMGLILGGVTLAADVRRRAAR